MLAYPGKVIGDGLDSGSFLADDVLVEPGGTGDLVAHDGVGFFVHLGEGQAQLLLVSPQGDSFAGGIGRRHLDENAGLRKNLVDGVALGTNDVLVLRFLHLYAHLTELALLLLWREEWKNELPRYCRSDKFQPKNSAIFSAQCSRQGSVERKL